MSIVHELTYAPHPTPTRSVGFFLTSNNDTYLYGVGNVIYLRSFKDPLKVDLFTNHNSKVTTCSFCWTGRYIASGEETGKVLVWTPQNEAKTVSLESQPLSGPIFDISWTDDNQRIAIVGEGKSSYGVVIQAETGSSQGEVQGHSRQVTSCALKPTRPFRLITVADDLRTNFYEGPPFKFKTHFDYHEKFILCVRYTKDGSKFGSVGLDGCLVVCDGKDASQKFKKEFGSGITGLSWSPDGKSCLLSLMNGNVLEVDENGNEVNKWQFGNDVVFQQAGVLWGNEKISVSLNGDINYLGGKTLKGHGVGITGLGVGKDWILSGDSRGKVLKRKKGDTPYAAWLEEGPSVKGIVPLGDNFLVALGNSSLFLVGPDKEQKLPVDFLVSFISSSGSQVAMANLSDVLVLTGKAGEVPLQFSVDFEITAVGISPSGEVALGDKKGNIKFYQNGKQVADFKPHSQNVVVIAYSKDGSRVGSSSLSKDITVLDRKTLQPVQEGWIFHSSPVTNLIFLDNDHLITTSKDRSIRQWCCTQRRTYVVVEKSHIAGINCAVVDSDGLLWTASDDGALKRWSIKLI